MNKLLETIIEIAGFVLFFLVYGLAGTSDFINGVNF